MGLGYVSGLGIFGVAAVCRRGLKRAKGKRREKVRSS